MSVSGTAYDNYNNTITAVFSNTQTGTPTLGTLSPSNGTVSSILMIRNYIYFYMEPATN